MTEINVSAILNEDCGLLSASQAELGPDAGRITWANCLALAEREPSLVTAENRDAIRRHYVEYGAWEREEIDAWSDVKMSALVWQEAAADTRHFFEECDGDVEIYEEDCEEGRVSGRLTISDDGKQAWIYLGL